MILRRTAEKAVERWKVGGAFSFRSGDVTFVIDPSKVLYIIQHDLTIKFGLVKAVKYTPYAEALRIETVNGNLSFEVQ